MKKLFLFFIFLYFSSFAQEKKYQSLLWEVSGKDLPKKSYIYGTMHVSDKVSYHLSDAFYTHLLNADIIANESEPRTWTELFNMFSFYSKYTNNKAFYTNFYIQPLERDQLYSLFQSTNYNLLGLLSRTNEAKKEFQEETYLDMFIYKTGRKYNKKTIGLENVKTSTLNIIKAEALMDKTEVEKNYQTLLKVLKNKPYNEALLDYYREKDLDMIETLTALATPESYLKALLYDRNVEMVSNMEINMKNGSLFSAIGAAHLPGNLGVIELLRQKGYIVTPIFDNYTEKGKALKKQIEEFFIKPDIKLKTTADGTLTIPVFEVVLENNGNIESPDLANGGYLNIKRTFLNDFLNKNNKIFNPKTLDSLFYENIPGEIISKKVYTEKNYLVYDIKNRTKTGNAQHYRYYITPLEIISVIMGGEGEYVRIFENEIFSKIVLKDVNTNWETISPIKGAFQVTMPAYYSYTGNNDNGRDNEDMKIIAHDKSQNSSYFLIEKTLQDNNNLEDSNFEIKRIHYEFYNQHNIDSTATYFDKNNFYYTSKSKLGDKTIELKSLIKGNKYYLLGTIGANEVDTKRFFSSFTFMPILNNEVYKTFTDSTAFFKIDVPEKQNEHLDFITDKAEPNNLKKKNYFVSKHKNYEFLSSTGNLIELRFSRAHKYVSDTSMDSIWGKFRKFITKNSIVNNKVNSDLSVLDVIESNKYHSSSFEMTRWSEILFRNEKIEPVLKIVDEKIVTNKENTISTFTGLVVNENSRQAIKYKGVFRDGTFYSLKSLVDKQYKNDNTFIEKTFNSFTLIDTTFENTVFENKLDVFIKDAMSPHDSIRYSALKSIEYLKIRESDLDKFQNFIANFNFNADETEVLGELYEKIGKIKSPQVIPFLESVYKKPNVNTVIQFSVLRALTFQESKEAYKKILSLLEYDLPISDSKYDVSNLFNIFGEDLENSQVMFPDVFQFYSIQEYHKPIIELTNYWIENKLVNSKKLKSFKKMLLTNAKLEVKRLTSWKNKQLIKDDEEVEYDGDSPSSELIDYLNILYGFKKESNFADLFTKVESLNIDDINLALAKFEMQKENHIQNKTIDKIVDNSNIRFKGFQMLWQTKQKEKIQIYGNENIAKSAVIYFENIDSKKDSLSLYETKKIRFNNTDIKYYFFKKITIDKNSYNFNKTKVVGIGFITNNDNLIVNAFHVITGQNYLEEKEIDAIIKRSIDESLNDNHIRVTYGKFGEETSNYNEEDY